MPKVTNSFPPFTWECQIGGPVDPRQLMSGSDFPMRNAIERAYIALTGTDPLYCFSGWGSELSVMRKAVVENRDLTDNEHEGWQAVNDILRRYPFVLPDLSRDLS